MYYFKRNKKLNYKYFNLLNRVKINGESFIQGF